MRYASILFAVLVLPLPSVYAQEDAPHEPPLDDGYVWTYNLLVIDSGTGLVLERHDVGANFTLVRVSGLVAGSEGYNLKDPNGWLVFKNRTANERGEADFWDIDLIIGLYTVTQMSLTNTERTILTFLPGGAMPVSQGSGRTKYNAQGTAETCSLPASRWEQRESKEYLTPVLIVHAPYGGKATGTQEWTETYAVFVTPAGRTSTTAIHARLDTANGNTVGLFRPATWAVFVLMVYRECRWMEEGTKTFAVAKWGSGNQEKVLAGISLRTDKDDTISLEAGFTFDHRYKAADTYAQTETGGLTMGKSGSTLYRFGGSMRLGSQTFSFLNIRAEAEVSSGHSHVYTYSFPAKSKTMIDWQQSDKEGWTFCTPAYSSC